MKLVDANLLLYAYSPGAPQHEAARHWLEQEFAAQTRLAIPWLCLIAFVRLKSNPRVFSRPDSAARCWEVAESWLAEANVFVPEPGPEHRRIFGRLLASAHGNTVNDAYLAALAIENGCIVCSTDSDFALFAPELRWENPLRHQTP